MEADGLQLRERAGGSGSFHLAPPTFPASGLHSLSRITAWILDITTTFQTTNVIDGS